MDDRSPSSCFSTSDNRRLIDISSFSGSSARNALSASVVVRDLLLDATPQEQVIVSATTLFFPVILRLPDTLKETIPAAQSRAIEKRYVMRFYNVPSKGGIIEFKGHAWGVVGLYHLPLIKGSPGQDKCPEVITEYIGAAAE